MFTQIQPPPQIEINGSISPPLLENVKHSIGVSVGKICGSPVYYTRKKPGLNDDGIVGIISLIGDLNLSLMVGFTPDSAVKLAHKFAGFEISFDSPEMGEVIAELTNVLAGAISGGLETINIKTQISFPTVARCREVELLLPGKLLSELMNFEVMDTTFWVKLVVAKRR